MCCYNTDPCAILELHGNTKPLSQTIKSRTIHKRKETRFGLVLPLNKLVVGILLGQDENSREIVIGYHYVGADFLETALEFTETLG